MATKRMFDKGVVNQDSFLEMPLSTQALYFHLGMEADVRGFVPPKKVMRMIGASDDDLRVLITKGFVLLFDSGVIVITDWNRNNLIREDREAPTIYHKEWESLELQQEKYIQLLDNSRSTPAQHSIAKHSTAQHINNNAPADADIVENLLNESGPIKYEWQELGLRVFEMTGAPENKKAECMRLAKTLPAEAIMGALSYVKDYPGNIAKWKMFLWKLNNEQKNSKTSS